MQLAFGLVRELLEEPDSKVFSELYSKIQNQEDIIDQVEIGIARYLDNVSSGHLSDNTKMETRQMLRQISELESIGDSCFNLSRTMNRSRELGLNFNDYHLKQIRAMMKLCDESLTLMNQIMKKDRNMRDLRDIFRIENDINHLRNTLKADNIRAVNDLEYGYSVGTMYMDLVNECEKLGDYVVNVAQARFGK